MQTTINISLDVPKSYQLDTLKQELTEYAKKLVAKAKPKAKAEKQHYAFEALRGFAQTDATDEELLDEYLEDKYGIQLMKVFLDTNIFIEFVSLRKQETLICSIFETIKKANLTAAVSVGGMYTIAYLLTRIFKKKDIHQPELNEKVRLGLNGLIDLAEVIDCSQDTIQEAINDERFTDIEDSFQYHCAEQHDCDVLLTINIKDYKNVLGGRPEVLTPEEFVEKFLK